MTKHNLKNTNKSSRHRQNSTQTDTSNLEHPLLLTEKLKIELDFQFSNSIQSIQTRLHRVQCPLNFTTDTNQNGLKSVRTSVR